MADGGEGTTHALVAATGGSIREAQVTGPLGEPVTARSASSATVDRRDRDGLGVRAGARTAGKARPLSPRPGAPASCLLAAIAAGRAG